MATNLRLFKHKLNYLVLNDSIVVAGWGVELAYCTENIFL